MDAGEYETEVEGEHLAPVDHAANGDDAPFLVRVLRIHRKQIKHQQEIKKHIRKS